MISSRMVPAMHKRTLLMRLVLLLLALPLLHGCIIVAAGGAAVGAAVHDRRGGDVMISDRRTQLGITDAINRDKQIVHNNFRVKVVVYNGTVLLCGQVANAEMKQRAQTIADTIEGAQRIENRIEITDDPDGFWRRRGDNALSVRVKTALLDITSMPGFDASRVNVTASNHVVYLMGVVSHEEADASTEIVRNVSGVDKVVKLFEYREPDGNDAKN
jgi:osmotically-inducible protein OsmY